MFAAERHQKIRQLLLEYKRADVPKLSKLFNVSEVTIRKDLEQLEKEGFLIRTHGGAVINETSVASEPLGEPLDTTILSRMSMIGTITAHLIMPHELIFIGSGRTCTEAAKHIKNIGTLTVVTNNISAAIELSENKDITIITTGGNFRRQNNCYSLASPSVVTYLSSCYMDKAIVTPDGISLSRGVSMQDELIAQVYRTLFERANKKILIATSEKFGRNAMFDFADINSVDQVVSDEAVPDEYLEAFYAHDIRVYTSYNIEEMKLGR